ncbi:hypothetical protein DR64_1346 [Paraburkholderia xenovorans LB400]|jgi:hypothetical protein|nr:hypothetical protein DR64_1346 [Paraburkholderia xenovorans LB400]
MARRGCVRMTPGAPLSDRPSYWTPDALRQRVEAMIARELSRCERSMTPVEWHRNREWITANVVEAARLWMREKATRGEL